MLSRLISVALSTLLLAGFGVLIVKSVTSLDGHAVAATQELVKAGAARIELELQHEGRDLVTTAERFAGEQTFANDLKALVGTLAVNAPSAKVAERLKARVDALKASLQEQVAILREERPRLTAVTIVDEVGVVLLTDSTVFAIGDRLAVPKEEPADEGQPDAAVPTETPPDAAADAAPAPTLAPPPPPEPAGKGGFVLTALDDEVQQFAVADAGSVKWVGAAPIKLKGTVVGAVILEQKLVSLPHAAGVEAMLLLGDAVVIGKPPRDFDVAAVRDSEQAYVLVARDVEAVVPGVGALPIGPLFVEPGTVGLWVQRFSIAGVPTARGLAYADVSPLYSELAGLQVVVLLLLFGVWLGHAMILLVAGAVTSRGLDRIASFLARVNQGAADERQLNEKAFPSSLRRLVILLNRTLERSVAGAAVAPLARAPSLDDVLQAHQGESPDVGELEFKGITDSGSLDVGVAAAAPPEADGFESMVDVAQAVDAAAPAESHPEQLPEAPEAFAALDSLGQSTPPTAPPPQPAVAPAPASAAVTALFSDADFEAPAPVVEPSAPAAVAKSKLAAAPATTGEAPLGDLLDEYAKDATTVMHMSPQLIAALRDAGSANDRRQQATDKVSSNVAAADQALAAIEAPAKQPAPIAKPAVTATPVAPRPATAKPAPSAMGAIDLQATNVMPLAVAKQMAAKLARPEPGVNPHFRDVFDQFVETRKKCGEGTADLTFDKFVAKLEKSKEAVIAKHQCADVRFQVYVKDGKAALKALPAR